MSDVVQVFRANLSAVAGAVVEESLNLIDVPILRQRLEAIAEYAHLDNKLRGWWTDLHTGLPLRRNVGELLMLMVSEIGEIPAGNEIYSIRDDKLPRRLMYEVELADCAIRILDTVGALAPRTFYVGFIIRSGQAWVAHPVGDADLLLGVVRDLSLAMECHRKNKRVRGTLYGNEFDVDGFGFQLGAALHSIFRIAHYNGFDLPTTIHEKMVFNANREDHKAEVRRRDGGKAY